jgi:hypothetical protein
VAVAGETLLAPAGLSFAGGQKPGLVAYRLPGASAGTNDQ